jgi:integrase
MPRRVRESNLETRTARAKLKPRGKPYFKAIALGLHVGYRKNKTGGRWVVRGRPGADYMTKTLGDADDTADADGISVLDFWQAQDKAREWLGSQSAERPIGPYKVKTACADYLENRQQAGKNVSDSRSRIKTHILPKLGKKDVADLKASELRRWIKAVADGKDKKDDKTEKGEDVVRRQRASANRTLTILKAALNLAWREGHIESDKAWRVVEPFRGVDAARVRYLQVSEAQRLINAAEPGFRELVQGALQTGARYSELGRLHVEDFDSNAGTVTILQSKAGKTRHVVLTDEGVEFFRQVCMGRSAHDFIFKNEARIARRQASIEEETARRLERGESTEDLVLNDDGQWRASEQARPMADACTNAKIDPPIGFHGLRHTWASLSVMAGMPLMVVAKNLGHSDTRMVERHYGHMAPSFVADAIRQGAPKFGLVEPSNVTSM